MNLRKFVDKLKPKKNNFNPKKIKLEDEVPQDPFIFKYNSICPAISIICLDIYPLNTPGRLLWLSELFSLFNTCMNTDIYKITQDDLIYPSKWFTATFGHDLFFNAKEISNSPLLWGKYIWSLLHIVSLFWTKETHSTVVFLLTNVNYILPCQDCQKHYVDLIKDQKDILNNLSNLVSSVNFVINLREIIGKKKKIFNRIPEEGNYSFLDLYNYILPLVEPEIVTKKNKFSSLVTHAKCNCRNKKLF